MRQANTNELPEVSFINRKDLIALLETGAINKGPIKSILIGKALIQNNYTFISLCPPAIGSFYASFVDRSDCCWWEYVDETCTPVEKKLIKLDINSISNKIYTDAEIEKAIQYFVTTPSQEQSDHNSHNSYKTISPEELIERYKGTMSQFEIFQLNGHAKFLTSDPATL